MTPTEQISQAAEKPMTGEELIIAMLEMDNDPLFYKKFPELWDNAYDISPYSRYSRALGDAAKLGIELERKRSEKLVSAIDLAITYIEEIDPEDRTVTEKQVLYHLFGSLSEYEASK